MQFSKMQNKIYGSLVTIQYHTKCTNPLYPNFTCKKISVIIFCCNLYLVIAYVLVLTTNKCSHLFISNCVHTYLSVITPNNVTTSSTKMRRFGIPQPISLHIGSKSATTTTKVGVILLIESQQ